MDPVASKLVTDLDGEKKLATYSPIQGRVVIQTVREEDEYMQHLETIVQRDYFPDLATMHQNSNRLPVADASQRSTTSRWSKSDSRNPERADPTAVNLDRYLANNTTEDDASFSELIEETERKRRIKLSSFFPSLEAPSAGRHWMECEMRTASSALSTPQAAGYRFMDASPSPAPSILGASPFMTWGELDATPSRLDDGGVNTPLVMSGAPAFLIAILPFPTRTTGS
ncbi:hypothetical protein FGIG_08160 [Fasciola gigantica]|uniref:Uncharacterized protein n=1 Tax=Fasciola gigantica TaxID=46835 RepID=A0A504Y8B2_FASGI|nr:hypothetical protein FGIG_08160 [Fasciola gigantica]